MNKPAINVTPLIDVLLVLLIIFMTVAPLKPSAFRARVPAERNDDYVIPHVNPMTLIVTIAKSGMMQLNKDDAGTTADTSHLTETLQSVFAERIRKGDVSESFADDPQRPTADRIGRTVFIKAPRTLNYGDVARVVDAVKTAGAFPISLQIDDLDQ